MGWESSLFQNFFSVSSSCLELAHQTRLQVLPLLLGTLGQVTQPLWALSSLPLKVGHNYLLCYRQALWSRARGTKPASPGAQH